MGAAKLRPDFGIIGLGRFGTLAAATLREIGEVVAHDLRPVDEQAAAAGIRLVSLAEAAGARHVILAVPIGRLRSAVMELAPLLLHRTVLIDTCSVKVDPASILLEQAPPHVDILATHPLFGPDSAAHGLAGLKIVLCPVRGGHPRLTQRFLEKLGLTVILASPDEHDRQIAETQAVVQWIGRALERMGSEPRVIDTVGHLKLLEILHYVSRDTWELFRDMQTRNPYAASARRRFLDALIEVEALAMKQGMAVVYRASGMTEAEIVKGYLESQGIPVDLDYESVGPVVGLTMDGLGEVRVVVPEDWEGAARDALALRPGVTGDSGAHAGDDPHAA